MKGENNCCDTNSIKLGLIKHPPHTPPPYVWKHTIWQPLMYCIWQLNGDTSSSSLSLVWEVKILVIIQKGLLVIMQQKSHCLQCSTWFGAGFWGWVKKCLCGWDPWTSDGLQPPTISSSNTWEARSGLNTAIRKGDLDNAGRWFPFKTHGGVVRGGPETWAALCLQLNTANCLAPEFGAEPGTSVFNVGYLSHDKAPWTGLQTSSLPWF